MASTVYYVGVCLAAQINRSNALAAQTGNYFTDNHWAKWNPNYRYMTIMFSTLVLNKQ